MKLRVVPASLKEANEMVSRLHRHNAALGGGSFFTIGLTDEAGVVHGYSIVGPVSARLLYHPTAAELKRLVTDGTPNACSMLYGASWRAAKALGYETLFTYTLEAEPGTSLRAAGWVLDDAFVPARVWKSRAPEFAHLRWSERPNACASSSFPRKRWVVGVRRPTKGGALSDAELPSCLESPIVLESVTSNTTEHPPSMSAEGDTDDTRRIQRREPV